MAACKVSGLDVAVEDGVPAVKIKAGRCAFVQVLVALTFVAVPYVLLYAYRFSFPVAHGGAAAFLGSRVGRGVVAGADGGGVPVLDNQVGSPCSPLPDHTICCDRSNYNSDVCFMAGDVRTVTDGTNLSLQLFPPSGGGGGAVEEERIQPYTRKWDGIITKTIHEVKLRAARPEEAAAHRCDVRHAAPALVVTAGGYSRNFFHAFNDGFLPAWLTVQHLRRRVVLAVIAYDPAWAGRFGEIIAGLSSYHVVDLLRNKRTHCFPDAIVGSRYHDFLAVDPARLRDNKTIVDFHNFLAKVYEARDRGKPSAAETAAREQPRRRLRLGIVSRKGWRVLTNQAEVALVAASVGFDVDVVDTGNDVMPPFSAVHATVSAYDALVGVHGADMTALLFLRPGAAALIQVAPLGLTDLSLVLYGMPAMKLGLLYEQYDVAAEESSLSRKYPPDHVVVADPARARREQGSKEWDLIENVYLRGQNVTLNLGRFRKTLARVHSLLQQRRRSLPAADASSPEI